MRGMSPSFMKIWICRSSPRSGYRNVWTRIKNVNGACRLSNFWNYFSAIWFPVAIGDHGRNMVMSLWLGDKAKKQWSGGIAAHPAPQKFRVQKFAGKFLASIFGIKTASSSMIIFQRFKLLTRSITHLCWCNWRTSWRKNMSGISPRWSCSCTTKSRLTGRLQPRRNWPTCDSTATYSLDCKNNWKVVIFRPTRRSFLPRRPGWTDKLLNFFWVPCKT